MFNHRKQGNICTAIIALSLNPRPRRRSQERYLLIYRVNSGNADAACTRSLDRVCLDYLSYGRILMSGMHNERAEQAYSRSLYSEVRDGHLVTC